MGMFDYVRSSYNLGRHFTNVTLQTKDLEPHIGGTMSFYWLDPRGRLWEIDEDGCYDWTFPQEEDKGLAPWLAFRRELNGNHGKVRPRRFTGDVRMYPDRWDGDHSAWPETQIRLIDGVYHGHTPLH